MEQSIDVNKWYLKDFATLCTLIYKVLSDEFKGAWRFKIDTPDRMNGEVCSDYELWATSSKYGMEIRARFESFLNSGIYFSLLTCSNNRYNFFLTSYTLISEWVKLRRLLLKIAEKEITVLALKKVRGKSKGGLVRDEAMQKRVAAEAQEAQELFKYIKSKQALTSSANSSKLLKRNERKIVS